MKTDEQIIQLIRQRKFESVRYACIDRLTLNRIDAQAWAFLGQAMVGLKRGNMARLCFERVSLLDPFANWLPKAWNDAARVPNGMSDKQTLRLFEFQSVPVSACILTRDSSRTIRQCIEALMPAVDEIVVVDTGSTDDTIEIVESLGLDVHHFEWVDDFSAARNYAQSIASHDWIISVDSDEILQNPQAVRLTAGLFNGRGMALTIAIINKVGDQTDTNFPTRMYQPSSGIRWAYPIHENLMPPSGRLQTHPINIQFTHDGYDPDATNQEDKINRNIRIITSALHNEPHNHVFLFYLGREQYRLGDMENSIHNLKLAQKYDDGESGIGPEIEKFIDEITKLQHSHL